MAAEIDNRLLLKRLTETFERVERSNDGGSGNGGGGGRMEARVAKLESDVKHIDTDVGEIRRDIRELRGDIKALDGKFERNFHITWAGLIAGVLGLAWLIARAAKW